MISKMIDISLIYFKHFQLNLSVFLLNENVAIL